MSTQPLPLNLTKTIKISAGDSLANIASEVLGDYSSWRELAVMNDIDIFKAIEIGQTLTIPTKEEAERRFKDQAAIEINGINKEVQSRVKEILNSREVKTITKLLGINIDQDKILKDLDLSSISKSLSAPTKAERIRKALKTSSYEPEVPIWRIIDWVLTFALIINISLLYLPNII
ncbi:MULTISPECIES: LysM peptidoglycan-binding domain-containing protein [Calothrix]|uniref:LysM peptidoglycan-binding domain-containing protein n=2 Tax=Calothrix TaxID=1186 RepID=A0ABR8A9E2_9CYAN|nr:MULTISPECIES: LysM peptidoglycan-binding domain-containing protein [Calothrix]MBD2196617.1 LysM peptidoglycan-binding domain-containing protein [Calothrix parietina FACHB-288]MBD2228018.1 LysM peptidoglycan-binding domain-containing protein [Calothrix anomala FACHB-343]